MLPGAGEECRGWGEVARCKRQRSGLYGGLKEQDNSQRNCWTAAAGRRLEHALSRKSSLKTGMNPIPADALGMESELGGAQVVGMPSRAVPGRPSPEERSSIWIFPQ